MEVIKTEPEEVLTLTNRHFADRHTKIDELTAEIALQLIEIKELLASSSEIPGAREPAVSFSYPQDGRTTLMSEGTLEIDYLTGRVKLPTGGTDELSDNLQNHNLRFVRSLMITTDRTCYLRLDNRDAIPIPPGTLTPLTNIQFSNLKLRITNQAYVFVIASTNPGGVMANRQPAFTAIPTLQEPGQVEWSYLYETPDDSPIPPFSVLEHQVITVEEGYRLLLKGTMVGAMSKHTGIGSDALLKIWIVITTPGFEGDRWLRRADALTFMPSQEIKAGHSLYIYLHNLSSEEIQATVNVIGVKEKVG